MLALALLALLQAQPFHTSPACWDGPRIVHDVGARPARAVSVERLTASPGAGLQRSPNGAYGYELLSRPTAVDNPGNDPTRLDVELRIWHERPYLLRLVLPDVRNPPEPHWINEKLLYLRVWWGRIVGSDLVLDVEAERLLIDETVLYGAIAHQQWLGACQLPEWRNSAGCRCSPWLPDPPGTGAPAERPAAPLSDLRP